MLDIPFIVQFPAAVSNGGAFSQDIFKMVLHAGPMVKFVILILGLFSVFSWAIILLKIRVLRRAKLETESFLELFRETRELSKIYKESEDLQGSPVASLFRAGYAEYRRMRRFQHPAGSEEDERIYGQNQPFDPRGTIIGNLERSLKRATIDQINRMETAVSFLATTGNTAPFIGLFGTVWGIMESFRGIGLKGSANLAVVAPGISEALIATAAGLAAAIPAVVAFNHFTRRIAAFRAEMDVFASDFLSTVERQLFRKETEAK